MDKVLKVREAAAVVRTREADAALLAALDEDGNGLISINEFCELSKMTGLSKVRDSKGHTRARMLACSSYMPSARCP